MTNFDAIKEFRAKSDETGCLVSESVAHLFAGVCRVRWNELRRSDRVPIVQCCGLDFVALSWIERRSIQVGKKPLLQLAKERSRLRASIYKLVTKSGNSRASSVKEASGKKGLPKENLFKSPTIQKRKRCKDRAKR